MGEEQKPGPETLVWILIDDQGPSIEPSLKITQEQ